MADLNLIEKFFWWGLGNVEFRFGSSRVNKLLFQIETNGIWTMFNLERMEFELTKKDWNLEQKKQRTIKVWNVRIWAKLVKNISGF